MVANLMMSAKLATIGLLELIAFLTAIFNKGCDVKTLVHDVTNKILSRD